MQEQMLHCQLRQSFILCAAEIEAGFDKVARETPASIHTVRKTTSDDFNEPFRRDFRSGSLRGIQRGGVARFEYKDQGADDSTV